jgi:hypothetical protein
VGFIATTLLVQWVPPLQARKPTEVTIRCNPLRAALNRHRRDVGVGDQISLRRRRLTQSHEDLPAMWPRCDRDTVWLPAKLFREPDRIGPRARHLEHSRMRDDPQEPAHYEIAEPVGRVRFDLRLEPRTDIDAPRGDNPRAYTRSVTSGRISGDVASAR